MCSVFKPPLNHKSSLSIIQMLTQKSNLSWHKVNRLIILQNLFNFICWFSPNSQRYMFLLVYVRGGHTYCVAGRKTAPKKLSGHQNVSKKAWRAKFNLLKVNIRVTLTINIPLSTIIYSKPYQMQLQLLKLCIFLSGVAEFSILFDKPNFQKSLKGT